MAISAEQAAQLASAYQSGDAGLQSLVNQMGVTQADVAQYFPGFDVGAAGLTLPTAASAAAPAAPDYANLINQAYSSVGITSPDQPGASYWQSQLQSGAIKPEDFQRSFLTAATGVTEPTYASNVAKAKELLSGLNTQAVTQAYQDVLGRAGDTAGIDYFTQQLASGALKPEDLTSTLAQAAIPVAKTLEDRIALQKYLGKDIYAPEEFLRGTSGFGYQDIVDYINANIQDPVKIAQAAARYGVDPAEILAAKQAVGGQDIPTIKAIEDYLAQGKAGLGTRVSDIVSSTFGNTQEIAQLEKDLGLQPGDFTRVQTSQFDPTKFSSQSIEEIEKAIRENPINKLQEANRLSRMAQNIYGVSSEDAKKLRDDLIAGKSTDSKAKEFYNELINSGLTKDLQDKLLIDAATRAPGSKFFQDNPNVLTVYKPIDNIVASPKDSGQYGYYNDAPILSATEADRLLGNKTYVGGNNYFGYGSGTERDDSLGWDLRSKYAGYIANGAGVVGVKATEDQINEFDRIQKKINELGGERNGYVTVEQTDPETGRKFMSNVPVSDFFTTEVTEDGGSNGGENYKLYQETMNALNQGAQQLGLNPASFGTPSSLFKAVDDKLQNTYIVTGRANNWDEDVANRAGITGVGQSRGGVNHAQVLYERVGDKLIPVKTLKTFNFDDPNTTRGFFGDLAQGIASIPFVAEIAAYASGGNPAVYAALKGAQTLALGGDLEDAIKAGGMAYLASNYIPKVLGPDLQLKIAQTDLVSSLAQSNTALANFITKAGSNAILSSGIATLTGQDPVDAATRALISSGVFQTTKAGLDFTDAIPEQYKNVVANIISSSILGQDPTKSLTGMATNILSKELKDVIKTRDILNDTRSPTIQA
jgi:hypothetical protein